MESSNLDNVQLPTRIDWDTLKLYLQHNERHQESIDRLQNENSQLRLNIQRLDSINHQNKVVYDYSRIEFQRSNDFHQATRLENSRLKDELAREKAAHTDCRARLYQEMELKTQAVIARNELGRKINELQNMKDAGTINPETMLTQSPFPSSGSE
ncbi:hypothetical protein FQN57_002464 [Myotisia sp. PD_48]|nr:hypothetical protein FQN57_002464 [Myotisia sp. PD_48]